MNVHDWLVAAKEDATRRNMPELLPLLAGLAASTQALRDADEAQRLLSEPMPEPEPQDQ